MEATNFIDEIQVEENNRAFSPEDRILRLLEKPTERGLFNPTSFSWTKHILSGANLREQNLERQNLAESELYFTDFLDSDLSSSCFELSYASRANFTNCNLKDSNFLQAYLVGSKFCQADLRGALLEKANVSNSDFRGANLTAQILTNWLIELPIVLTGANLTYSDCQGMDFKRYDLRNCRFAEANLQKADLREADLRGANLLGANLQGADLRGADLRGANLENANLTNALFTGANLEDCQGANKIKPAQFKGEYKLKIKKKERVSALSFVNELDGFQIAELNDGLMELFDLWKDEIKNIRQSEIIDIDKWSEMASLILDFEWFGIRSKDHEGKYTLRGQIFAAVKDHNMLALIRWTQENETCDQVINLLTASPMRVLGKEKSGGASTLIAFICAATQRFSDDLAKAGKKRINLKLLASSNAKSWYQKLGFQYDDSFTFPVHLKRNSLEYVLLEQHMKVSTVKSKETSLSEVSEMERRIRNKEFK